MDSGEMEQWFSYEGKSGVEEGVEAYSRYLRGVDGGVVVDEGGWVGGDVPATEPLVLVKGEPSV